MNLIGLKILISGWWLLSMVTISLAQQSVDMDNTSLSKKQYKMLGSIGTGMIVPHTKRFGPDVTQPSLFGEIGVSKLCAGDQEWHHRLGFPDIGAILHYSGFGDREIFGQAVGLFPFINFKQRWAAGFDFNFRLGFGLAYLDTTYDPFDNPTNNVIGSHWNNLTQIQMSVSYQLEPLTKLELSSGLTHYSNGKVISPNLGINAIQVSLGLSYNLNGPEQRYQRDTSITFEGLRKNRWFFRSGFGAHNSGLGTPTHPVFTQTISYIRALSPVNNLWLGTTYAYDRSKLQLLAYTEKYGPRPARHHASDVSLFVGDEIMVGNVGIWFLCGAYLYNPEYRVRPIYFKLGVQYYFLDLPHDHRLFTFANIKSHLSIADYFEIGVGYKL